MLRRTLFGGLVFGLALSFSTIQAADEPQGKGRGKGGGGGREEMMKKMLEKFDADKDGKLSDDEKAKAREALGARGKGGPGRPEAGKPSEGKPGEGRPKGRGPGGPGGDQASREKFREQMIAKFDKDGDGKLSEDERATAKAAAGERKKKE